MVAGIGRADRLTGSRVAVLAHDGAELHPDIGKVALVIALHANPGNRSSAGRLFRSGNPDVVFRAAGRHTGFTARAPVQIHRHSPTMCHRFSKLFIPETME